MNAATIERNHWIAAFERTDPRLLGVVAIALIFLIGFADHLSSNALSYTLVYAVPIGFAAWFVGTGLATTLSVLSATLWVGGDLAAGVRWEHFLIPVWNWGVRVAFYLFFVALLTGMHKLFLALETSVHERAEALNRAMIERKQLEHELLRVSEREQNRIGQDIHDGLCQHLTGMALATRILADDLAAGRMPDATQAERIIGWTEEAITLSRVLVKGLSPVDARADGLMGAMDELANKIGRLYNVSCVFECEFPILINDVAWPEQLYRIAQEAANNAARHGHATEIRIVLEITEEGITLRVCDNGDGIVLPVPQNGGMGLRIMAQRASIMGATFEIGRARESGTIVTCMVPPAYLPTGAVNG